MKLILSILFVAFAASAQVPQETVNNWMLMANAVRSTAWSPTNVSGLVRWYDAQSIVGLNNGDSVSSWTDKMGTTNFTQTEASLKPTYISSDATFGNKPCVYFNANTVSMTNSSVGDSTLTLFVIAYVTNITTGPLWCFKYSNGANCRITPTAVDKWRYISTATTNTGGACTASGAVVLKFDSTSSGNIRAQNGAYVAFSPNGTYDDSGDITTIGAYVGSSFKGFIGEILLYDSPLSDADVNKVGAYLANRWNFTWTDL